MMLKYIEMNLTMQEILTSTEITFLGYELLFLQLDKTVRQYIPILKECILKIVIFMDGVQMLITTLVSTSEQMDN